jgi:hypothetical protein
MLTTIIAERTVVGSWYTETGYGVTSTRRVVTRETVKNLQYDEMTRTGVKHYNYNVIETVSWYQNEGYPCDMVGSIQFGRWQQGIENNLPDWAR